MMLTGSRSVTIILVNALSIVCRLSEVSENITNYVTIVMCVCVCMYVCMYACMYSMYVCMTYCCNIASLMFQW